MLIETHHFKKQLVVAIIFAVAFSCIAGRPIDVFASNENGEGFEEAFSGEEFSEKESFSDEYYADEEEGKYDTDDKEGESFTEYSEEGVYFEDELPSEDSSTEKAFKANEETDDSVHMNEAGDDESIKEEVAEKIQATEETHAPTATTNQVAAEDAKEPSPEPELPSGVPAEAFTAKEGVVVEEAPKAEVPKVETPKVEAPASPYEAPQEEEVVDEYTKFMNEYIQIKKDNATAKHYTDEDLIMVAKTVEIEARGSNMTEKSKVAWCIVNRVDNGFGTISEVLQTPGAFAYRAGAKYTPDSYAVAKDVLDRWSSEKKGISKGGRTLPKEYLYFAGDGKLNHFRTSLSGGSYYDGHLGTPYN